MAATDKVPTIKVLFALHPGMDALDFIGPLEVITQAQHSTGDAGMSTPDPWYSGWKANLNTSSYKTTPGSNGDL